MVSKKSSEAASAVANSTGKLAQKDLTSAIKTSAASGWSGLSTWIGQAAQTTISITADAANSLTEVVVGGAAEEAPKLYQRPQDGQPSTKKFEGFGADEIAPGGKGKGTNDTAPSIKKNDGWGSLDDFQPELNGVRADGLRRENNKKDDRLSRADGSRRESSHKKDDPPEQRPDARRENKKDSEQSNRPEGLRRPGSNPKEADRSVRTATKGAGRFVGFAEEDEEPAETKFHMGFADEPARDSTNVVASAPIVPEPTEAVVPAKPAPKKQDGWDEDFFKDF